MSRSVPRPDDSRCDRPLPTEVLPGFHAPAHPGDIYISTYCDHGLGEGRDQPSQCRMSCKACHAPCACMCHGGRAVPFAGFSLDAEDELRATIRQVVREMGVAPGGPRGVELISDILSGVFLALDRDGEV